MPSEAKSNEKIAQKPCVLENKSCEMYTKPNPSCINFTRKNQTSKKNKCNKWNEVYLICKNKENPRPTFQNFQPSLSTKNERIFSAKQRFKEHVIFRFFLSSRRKTIFSHLLLLLLLLIHVRHHLILKP